jgi:2-oxoglutarate ferredoxin oxidoreductase subunit alpha
VGGGDITQGQDSYLQAVKGGGNGDYRLIVLAPNSVTECAKFTFEAFALGEAFQNPVLVLLDGALGQMVESCELPEPVAYDINRHDWVIKGRPRGETKRKATNKNWYMGDRVWEKKTRDKLQRIKRELQRWESINTEDAELVLVAYGVSSRVCRQAVREGRARGLKLGLIRPITLWPYPQDAFRALGSQVRGLLSVEMSIMPQMAQDIYTSVEHKLPVYGHNTAIEVPVAADILKRAEDILAGKAMQEEVL